MNLNRRQFLTLTGASAAALTLPRPGMAAGDGWRHFEVTYEVEPQLDGGPVRVWLPLPQDLGGYQRARYQAWSGNAEQAGFHREPVYGASLFHAVWDGSAAARKASVTVRFATRDRRADLAAASGGGEAPSDVALYLKPTPSMPVDGIVAQRAAEITRDAATPLDKARAIYEWIVVNTFRDPQVKGCGRGDIRFMLETGNLGGKCADLNSLYVGLARAAGLPAREVYGVRVADSAQFKCLGKAGDVSKAQHCRAEVWLPGAGWVAVDPADVRKAVLEERLPLEDERIGALRQRLFGYWEMNWMGMNHARDVALDPAARAPLNYFMYPHAESPTGMADGLDPGRFRYRISSREV